MQELYVLLPNTVFDRYGHLNVSFFLITWKALRFSFRKLQLLG